MNGKNLKDFRLVGGARARTGNRLRAMCQLTGIVSAFVVWWENKCVRVLGLGWMCVLLKGEFVCPHVLKHRILNCLIRGSITVWMDLQFYFFWFANVELTTCLLLSSNPNKSNRRSAVYSDTSLFPFKRVFSGWREQCCQWMHTGQRQQGGLQQTAHLTYYLVHQKSLAFCWMVLRSVKPETLSM